TAFVALFQSCPDALLVLDDVGVVTAANRRAEEMFQEVNGRSIMTLLEHGEFVSPGKERAPDAPSELHTCTAVRADGSRFSAEVSLSPSRRGGRALLIAAVRDLSDRERAAAALQRSLDEKLTLVQEVHHRVKNNLQIISSLITLQSEEMEDAQAQGAMMDTARRIQSMAFVHQQLYASDDLSRIDFGDYARSLCAALRDSMAPDAELHVVTEPCETPIERAVPAGLILNELLTNAFKHGRGDDGALRIEVEVRRGEGGYTFVVADHGRGIGTGHVRQGSMGQTLIRSLLRQLRAKRTDVDQGRGSRIEVAVPDEDP
ncbi:MAG: sensor histidine kinase, partial [Myxococcota bacterium]